MIAQSHHLRKFLPTMRRGISDSQTSTNKEKELAEKKQAISNGPGFEDFLSGNVGERETWKDYSGDLVKTKEMKR